MDKSERKGPIFCDLDGKWKEEIERRLKTGENPISLLALGKVKYKLLNYLNKRSDIKIIRVETKMKLCLNRKAQKLLDDVSNNFHLKLKVSEEIRARNYCNMLKFMISMLKQFS
jgi:pantothenate kinase